MKTLPPGIAERPGAGCAAVPSSAPCGMPFPSRCTLLQLRLHLRVTHLHRALIAGTRADALEIGAQIGRVTETTPSGGTHRGERENHHDVGGSELRAREVGHFAKTLLAQAISELLAPFESLRGLRVVACHTRGHDAHHRGRHEKSVAKVEPVKIVREVRRLRAYHEAPSAMASEDVIHDRARLRQGESAVIDDGRRALRMQSLIGCRRRSVWLARIGPQFIGNTELLA